MKKLILYTTIMLLLNCTTDQGEAKIYTYTVINKTEKAIVIKSYLSHNPSVLPIITNMTIGQEVTKKQTSFPPYNSQYNFKYLFGNNDSRDSIVVIYGNEKVMSFVDKCDNNDRNPLNFCIYNKLEETFTFTINDYNNAEDCNGNCD